MKNIRNNQSGFHVVEFALIAVVVIGLGFAGWRVYSANNSGDLSTTTEQQAVEVTVVEIEDVVAPEVHSSADLDAAQAALDQLEASDSLDESQFDEDVDELL